MTAPDLDAIRARQALIAGQDWTQPVSIITTNSLMRAAYEDVSALLDRLDAIEALHPVEVWREADPYDMYPTVTGCPTCRTDGPCPTRQAVQ